MKLSEKMEAFCQEYITDYNAKRAALRAGYEKTSAGASAKRLLKNEKVVARICELQKKYIKEEPLDDKNIILREIWKIYEKAMQEKPVMIWDKETKKYIKTGEYQFDDKTAMKCLELIMKLGGILSEKDADKKERVEIYVRVEDDES